MVVVLFGVLSHTFPQAIIAYWISPAGGGGGREGGERAWCGTRRHKAYASVCNYRKCTLLCFATNVPSLGEVHLKVVDRSTFNCL